MVIVSFSERCIVPDAMTGIRDELSQAGWTLVEEGKGNPYANFQKFCRGDIAAIFDARGAYGKERTYIGVKWAEKGGCHR